MCISYNFCFSSVIIFCVCDKGFSLQDNGVYARLYDLNHFPSSPLRPRRNVCENNIYIYFTNIPFMNYYHFVCS